MNTLFENEDLNRQAYAELVKAIEDIRKEFVSTQTDNYPSAKWVAGKFQQLSQLPHIEQSLKSGNITSDEVMEDYKKFIALKVISEKYGFIKKSGNKYEKTDTGSKFVQSLAKSFSEWRSFASNLKTTSTVEDGEWLSALSDEDKSYIEIYKSLSAKEYAYLIGLVEKQSLKKNYTNTIATSDQNDSLILQHLKDLGLINADETINSNLVKNMLDFLNEKTYARLKSFNNDITYIAKRISADKALLKNFLDRNMDKTSFRRTSTIHDADAMLDSMSNIDKVLVNKAENTPTKLTTTEKDHLTKMKVWDGDGFTHLGKLLTILLTKDLDFDNLRQRGEKTTQYSRLNQVDIGDGNNKASRSADKVKTRKQSFKNFLASK